MLEKDDYIQLLEKFIKKNIFTTESSESLPLDPSMTNKATSFLQTQESLSEKAKAGPVLKAMLFGFPNPRTLTFGTQNSKGEGFFLYILFNFSKNNGFQEKTVIKI